MRGAKAIQERVTSCNEAPLSPSTPEVGAASEGGGEASGGLCCEHDGSMAVNRVVGWKAVSGAGGRPELGVGSCCGPALRGQASCASDSARCPESSLLSVAEPSSPHQCTSTWTGRCSEKPTRSPAWA